MKLSGKPKGREQWRVILELLRMMRTFTPAQRKMLMIHGLLIEKEQAMNSPANITQLYRFYQVDNDWDLIEAMSRHIDKLQAKLADVTIQAVVRSVVREG